MKRLDHIIPVNPSGPILARYTFNCPPWAEHENWSVGLGHGPYRCKELIVTGRNLSESIARRTANLDSESQKDFHLEEAFQLGFEEFSWEMLLCLKKTA